eukprot:6639912-Pyramimonas_sp.AAC.1
MRTASRKKRQPVAAWTERVPAKATRSQARSQSWHGRPVGLELYSFGCNLSLLRLGTASPKKQHHANTTHHRHHHQ